MFYQYLKKDYFYEMKRLPYRRHPVISQQKLERKTSAIIGENVIKMFWN